MAGRDYDDDNSIEMIAADHKNETHQPQFMLNGPSISYSNSSYSKNQTEAEHDRASLNALKVAFSSLQGYHNDQAKKLFSLQRKYNILHEFVQSNHGNIDLEILEQSYPQDQSSMAQAAGAYNESQNLDFGNVRLQRELNMRNKQEILAKNNKITEYEQKIKEFLKGKERLTGDVEALAIVLDEKKAEIVNKDKDLRRLNQKIEELQAELDFRNHSVQENEQLRQRIELYERSGILNERDTEKDDLRARLRNFQDECQRLHTLYEEQDKNLDAKDKEITRLQSQCKQFEIENSILRSQRNEGNDMTDSGTNAELEKALELVKKQSSEIRTLKNAAEQQQTVIQEMLNQAKQNGAAKTGELRGIHMAEGESGHYFGDRQQTFQPSTFNKPGQEKLTDPRPVRSEMLSTTPRYSNPSNPIYRGSTNKLFDQRSVAISSPQIKESIVPTGNLNVRPMMANENRQPKMPAVNVADCFNTSPVGNVYVDTNVKPPRFRASDSDLSRLSGHDENRQKNNSSSLSPPGILTRNQDQHAYVNHGAKPKNADTLGMPARMTQSEVIYGNLSPKQDDTLRYGSMTRSAFYPVPDLNRKLENRPVGIPEENSAISTIRLYENEPDYENVFQNDETEEKRPTDARESNRAIYENFDRHKNDDRTYVVVPNAGSHGNFGFNRTAATNVEGESDKVRSLKICPSCNREFSRLNMEEFQQHVYDCFDSNDDQPGTLQAPVNVSQEDDRTCPMCSSTFPMTVPQETYEAHVLAHFGEEAPMERFEMVNS